MNENYVKYQMGWEKSYEFVRFQLLNYFKLFIYKKRKMIERLDAIKLG